MEYTKPWPSELNFKPYIHDIKDIVGRAWLYEEIEIAMKNSTYGVLLTAEMGYGKSAIMSYLSCVTDSSSAGFLIRRNLVSFHMCRFDALDTLRPENFIQNIAAGIANRIPEFGNILEGDRLAMDYIKSFRCSEDPLGCFDRIVLYPASKLQHTKEVIFIALDGLDECLELKSDSPSIVDVLEKKITKLQGVLKLLITSRKHQRLESSLWLLKRLHFLSSDERNKRDIETFLDGKLKNSFIQKTKHLAKNVLGVKDSNRQNIIDISEGNFLFVIQLLNSPSMDQLPHSLQHLFMLNFDRAFGQSLQSFEIVRPVLEVIVALYRPSSLEHLIEIAEISDSNKLFVKECFNGKLGYFFQNENGKVTFFHKAVSEFLLSTEVYNKFSISKQNGHQRISKFLLKTKSNVVDLMKHIIESKSEKLKNIFIVHGKALIKSSNFTFGDSQSMNVLHKVALTLDSYAVTKLLLRVIGCRHVDVHTLTNVSSVFLASAFGNNGTLYALFECGAKLDFRRLEPPVIPEDNMKISYIEFCKQFAYWGYNSLHIAAQHGHKNVVNFFLKNAPDLLNSENSLGLNPFHLAVEFGHVEVARLLLRKQPTLPDVHSLYYAARNNHTELLKLILSSGIKDKCLPCNGSMYWLNETDFINKHLISFKNKYRFRDDFRLINCQTSLEIAVQMGNIEIVDILLNQTVNAINCRDSRGRTPILTAVQYGRDGIFQRLLSAGAHISDVCEKGQDISHFEHFMSKPEIESFLEKSCPLYASVAHLAAIYGRRNILNFIPGYLLKSKDSINATPLHYGMCHKHIDVIVFLFERRCSFSAKTLNGSTPIHSAASCGTFATLLRLEEETISQESFDVVDNLNRSFMHYIFISVKDEDSRKLSLIYRKNTNTLMALYLTKSKYPKSHKYLKDIFNRTYLHYAAISGHVVFFELFISRVLDIGGDPIAYIQSKDYQNNTVLDLLFNSLPFFDTVVFHTDCPLNDIFLVRCNTNKSLLLSPHELCLQYVFQRFHWNNDVFSVTNLQKYIKQSIKQNSLNSIVLMKSYTKDRFHAAVEQIMPWILRNIVEYDKTGYMIALIFNTSFDFCDRKFEESILHKIMYNEDNKFWVHSPIYHRSPVRSYLTNNVEDCFDQSGYNLLQRAVSGGNAGSVEFLLKNNVSFSVSTKAGQDLLSLLVYHSPFFDRTEFFQNSFYIKKEQHWNNEGLHEEIIYSNDIDTSKSYNSVGGILLKHPSLKEKVKAQLKLNECLENSYSLSTVHILAAKGLKSVIEYSVKKYGTDILKCRNRFNFTALYFAGIFGHKDTVKYLNDSNVDAIDPNKDAELYFLMDALSNFFDKKLTSFLRRICRSRDKDTLIKITEKLCFYLKESSKNINNPLSVAITSLTSYLERAIEIYNRIPSSYDQKSQIVTMVTRIYIFISERTFNVLRKKMKDDSSSYQRDQLYFRFQSVLGNNFHSRNPISLCEKNEFQYLRFLSEEEKKFVSYKEGNVSLRKFFNLYENSFDDIFYSLSFGKPHIKIEVDYYTPGPRMEDYALYEFKPVKMIN